MIPADVAAEVTRLVGQDVELGESGYTIRDIAGEGAPLVGTVERRGDELWLVGPTISPLRLIGKLAHPRIAGPGYKVWVIGERQADTLRARRLGVLRPPF